MDEANLRITAVQAVVAVISHNKIAVILNSNWEFQAQISSRRSLHIVLLQRNSVTIYDAIFVVDINDITRDTDNTLDDDFIVIRGLANDNVTSFQVWRNMVSDDDSSAIKGRSIEEPLTVWILKTTPNRTRHTRKTAHISRSNG